MKIRLMVEDSDIAALLHYVDSQWEETPPPVDWAYRMVNQAYRDALDAAEIHMHEHGCGNGICEEVEVN